MKAGNIREVRSEAFLEMNLLLAWLCMIVLQIHSEDNPWHTRPVEPGSGKGIVIRGGRNNVSKLGGINEAR